MPKENISNNIRQLRFEKGEITQQELATRTGCARQTIIMLEQGRYVPSLALALRIPQAFESPVDDIFTLDSAE